MQSMSFDELGLAAPILQAVKSAGFENATPVQAAAIPEVVAGHDLMVSAPTGTGKTAAFMLPALHRISSGRSQRPGRGPRVLVLTPTRELAQQVTTASVTFGKTLRGVRTVSVLGGVSYQRQNRDLAQFIDILVATPGRLIDQMQQRRVDLSRLELLVLDEADRMLDMGFIEDVERIAAAAPAERQTVLFSATLDGEIGRLGRRILREPKLVQIATPQTRHENIDQRLHFVDDDSHRRRLLDHWLRDAELRQAIVFTATKRDADDLAETLSAQGHAVAALHGDMKQSLRTRTLSGMRQGRIRVLVATDVAARGIDVAGISHVINYHLPRVPEDYVHRIGRTGRAGAKGIALSFAGGADRGLLFRIQRFTGQKIDAHVVPGLEPKARSRAFDANARPRAFDPNARPRAFDPNARPRSFDPNKRPRTFDPDARRRSFDPNARQRTFNPDARPRTFNPDARQHAPRPDARTGEPARPFGDRPPRRDGDRRPQQGDRRDGGYARSDRPRRTWDR